MFDNLDTYYTDFERTAPMQPHQQRVVDEEVELLEKLTKLCVFIDSNPLFVKLDYDEQGRLKIQRFIMEQYNAVLLDRIDNFPV